MPVQSRARVVCVDCHKRKVKCDLEPESGAGCRECRRLGQPCVRRLGARTRKATTRNTNSRSMNAGHTRTPISSTTDTISWPSTSTNTPNTGITRLERQSHNDFTVCCTTGLAFESITVEESLQAQNSGDLSPLGQSILQSSQALALPRSTLLRALLDNYSHAVFHHCPVMEITALTGPEPPILLVLAVCMISNCTKPDSACWPIAEELHEKIKLLLAIDFEADIVRILQTVCIMSLWNSRSSSAVNLDGPDYWISTGLRLAQKIGLHRKETYEQRENSSLLRRIFWQLLNSDAMQVAFWGRSPCIRLEDYTVSQPTSSDFEATTTQALTFIEGTKLAMIMTRWNESTTLEKRSALAIDDLLQWLKALPADLMLYESLNQTRRSYDRAVSELWIQYFVILILTQTPRHSEPETGPCTSAVSFVASMCIVTLYDEIYCRGEILPLLPIHGFYCMAASLPIIYAPSATPEQEAWRKKRLDFLKGIVSYLRPKFGDADLVLGKVNGLQKKVDDRRERTGISNEEDLDSVLGAMLAKESLLFPFPDDVCEYMSYVYVARDRPAEDGIEEPVLDDHGGFQMDFSMFDLFDYNIDGLFDT